MIGTLQRPAPIFDDDDDVPVAARKRERLRARLQEALIERDRELARIDHEIAVADHVLCANLAPRLQRLGITGEMRPMRPPTQAEANARRRAPAPSAPVHDPLAAQTLIRPGGYVIGVR